MSHVVRPFNETRHNIRSAPISNPSGRRAFSSAEWQFGPRLNDPTLLDEQFDEMGCEVSVLLRIANQA